MIESGSSDAVFRLPVISATDVRTLYTHFTCHLRDIQLQSILHRSLDKVSVLAPVTASTSIAMKYIGFVIYNGRSSIISGLYRLDGWINTKIILYIISACSYWAVRLSIAMINEWQSCRWIDTKLISRWLAYSFRLNHSPSPSMTAYTANVSYELTFHYTKWLFCPTCKLNDCDWKDFLVYYCSNTEVE